MGSIHEVMEVFREAPSNSERGTKFEKLMVRCFDLGPTAVSAVRRGVVMDRLARTERQARHRNRPRCPRTGQWRVHGRSSASRRHAFGLFRAMPGVKSVGHVNILSTHLPLSDRTVRLAPPRPGWPSDRQTSPSVSRCCNPPECRWRAAQSTCPCCRSSLPRRPAWSGPGPA